MSAVADDLVVTGAKGGGKSGGGGGGRRAREAPNTLRSAATARVTDVLGEGEILGLVDGAKSIYYDNTPLQNDDGTYNFEGVKWHYRTGLPDQDPVPGQPGVERELLDQAVQVTRETAIVRTVTNTEADAVRVTIQIPALTEQNTKNADLNGSSVSIEIAVRPHGGAFNIARGDTIEGKTTSPYQKAYRIPLSGDGPWEVRVTRVTEDADKSNVRNETYLALLTEIIDAKLIYPDTALIHTEIDARQFGDTVPARKYDVYGLIVDVPDNYDPQTRTYSGLWGGQFKRAWTDNPAWVFHDIAIKVRYGAGLPTVDKWSLYAIGQYCDERVPDGFGGMEPRWTFNTVIADSQDAIRALGEIASVFRGMVYWGTNTVMPVADRPTPPVKLVTPANVIDGEFEYTGASRSERHSVALVSYNDPGSNDRLVVEVVERPHLVEKLGWRPIEITAIACNSRGQAHRVGEWALHSEENEGQGLNYRAGTDHADVYPGDIIKQTDPGLANARMGGRILTTGTTTLTLDRVPAEIDTNAETWYLDGMLPTGGIERREIDTFDGDKVTLVNPFSQAPIQGAVFVLASASIEPRLWRILTNVEKSADDGGLEYQITATEHDPTKYQRIEQGIYLPEPEDTLIPTGPLTPPTQLTVESYTYLAGGTQHQGLTASLTPSTDPRTVAHVIEAKGPTDVNWRTLDTNAGTSADLRDIEPGEWQVRGQAVDGLGRPSVWVYESEQLVTLLLPVPPDNVDIVRGLLDLHVTPNGGAPGQEWEVWVSEVPLNAEHIRGNARRAGRGSSVVVNDLESNTLYYLYVYGINAYGESDPYPVQATTKSDPGALKRSLEGQLEALQFTQEFQEEFNLISAPATTAGSVAWRAAQLRREYAPGLQSLELGFDNHPPGTAVRPVGWRGGNDQTGYVEPIGIGDAAYGSLAVDTQHWEAKCWRLIDRFDVVSGAARFQVDSGLAMVMIRFYTAESRLCAQYATEPLYETGTIEYSDTVPGVADYVELVVIGADTPGYADTIQLWFDDYDERVVIARPGDETPIDDTPLEETS